jgi:hypothetical protein
MPFRVTRDRRLVPLQVPVQLIDKLDHFRLGVVPGSAFEPEHCVGENFESVVDVAMPHMPFRSADITA